MIEGEEKRGTRKPDGRRQMTDDSGEGEEKRGTRSEGGEEIRGQTSEDRVNSESLMVRWKKREEKRGTRGG